MADVCRDWQLDFGVDDVLRSQSADPEVLRARRPRLVQLAQDALDEGLELIDPAVLTVRLKITDVRHNHVTLENGTRLSGALVVEHLGGAEFVAVMLCTIGSRLAEEDARIGDTRLSHRFALDAVGSAAVHALSAAACNQIETEASEKGLQTSLPLSPGLEGWPVEVGQKEIFSSIDPEKVGVELTPNLEMLPLKSVTTVLGVGTDMVAHGKICDYCSLRNTCRQKIA